MQPLPRLLNNPTPNIYSIGQLRTTDAVHCFIGQFIQVSIPEISAELTIYAGESVTHVVPTKNLVHVDFVDFSGIAPLALLA